MAVYDLRDKNSGVNPWNYLLAKGAGGLLDNFIGGMFQRDAEAREVNRSKKLYEAMGNVMTPQAGLPQPEAPRPEYGEEVRSFANRATRGGGLYDSYVNPTDNGGWSGLWDSTPGLGKDKVPGREDFLRGLARYGATAQQAKTLTDLYMNQFETADKLGYEDTVASRLGGLDYDVRGNAPEAARSAAVAGAYGVNMGPIYDRTAPGFTFSGADLGDRYGVFSQDNLTGNYRFTSHNKGTDPTHTADNISREKVANINKSATLGAAGIRANADLTPKTSVVYDKDGKAYYVDNRGGAPRGIVVQGPVKGQGAAKPLTTMQKVKIAQDTVSAVGMITNPEERWNTIIGMSGQSPEVLGIMASAAFPDGKIPQAAMEFLNGGGIRLSGQKPQAQPQVQTPNAQPRAQNQSQPQPQSQPQSQMSSDIAEARRRFPGETQGKSDEEIMRMLMQYQ